MYTIAKSAYRTVRNTLLSPFILADYFRFKRAGRDGRFSLALRHAFPQIFDKTVTTGFDRHYVYHTSWAVRKVRDLDPAVHIDIASSLYFSGILSAFIPVEFYDYRPAPLVLQGLTTSRTDLTNLHFADNSVPSLSCMHTIEHVGLGRYGDPIDPAGDIKAAKELTRVLSPGGSLIFVTPVGGQALLEFNAHRIYTYDLVLALFPDLKLVEFSYVPEHGPAGIKEHADQGDLANERYACGLFVFQKPNV